MARPIWKGHISFGLVNVPVVLYPAETRSDLHFRLLDSRNKAKVKYERVNEVTGEQVPWEEIVKAYDYGNGNYVVLTDEDFKKAAVVATQTIDIEDFVDRSELDHRYFDKPYYLVPDKHGEKGYVLLRETLRRSGKIGIAKVVIRTRQYLAALEPFGDALLLNILRYQQELRDAEEFDLPASDPKGFKISPKEIEMAERLVETMSSRWSPEKYHDEYRDALMSWIEQKATKGDLAEPPEPAGDEGVDARHVYNFMDVLKRSVEETRKQRNRPSPSAQPAKKTAARRKHA